MKFEEILDLAGDKIRVSPDGRYSIDDVMKYAMNASHGHRCNTHRRVREQFSLPVPDRVSFPGQGSHSVPVATADEIDRLLVLLPIARPIGRPRTRRLTNRRNTLGDSLYVMRTSFDAEHVKIGRSGDVLARAAALESGQNFRVETIVVFPGGKVTWKQACTRTWTVVAATWEQVASGSRSLRPRQQVWSRGRCSR